MFISNDSGASDHVYCVVYLSFFWIALAWQLVMAAYVQIGFGQSITGSIDTPSDCDHFTSYTGRYNIFLQKLINPTVVTSMAFSEVTSRSINSSSEIGTYSSLVAARDYRHRNECLYLLGQVAY